jgi:hypothetical protein
MRRGTYPHQKELPLNQGLSVLGKMRPNSNGCARFGVGDRVACLSKYDGQAELINLREIYLIPVRSGGKGVVALILDSVPIEKVRVKPREASHHVSPHASGLNRDRDSRR